MYIHGMDEQQRIPFSAQLLPGKRITVFAPHADDETLGCGGALMLHRATGAEIRIVILTDGAAGGDPTTRQQEAVEACRRMQLGPPDFWDFADRSLLEQVEILAAAMVRDMQAHPADLIYTTSPAELHPDHRAAATAAWQAVARRAGAPAILAFFEVGAPLHPNVLTDISAVYQAKLDAASAFTSQFHTIPYHHIATSLNVFRSLTLRGSGCIHAEGFQAVSSAYVRKHPLRQWVPGELPYEFTPHAQLQAATTFDCTVIVRTKNRPDLLREAIASILAQSTAPREVLIVNDGEATPPGILPASTAETTWREIQSKGSGRSAAWNLAASRACGKWLLSLDDDDVWFADHIATFAQHESSAEKFMYSDALKSVWDLDASGARRLKTPAAPFKGGPFDRSKLETMNFIPTCGWAVNRELWLELGGIDESLELFEDWEFLLRLSDRTDFLSTGTVTSEYRFLETRAEPLDWDAARRRVQSLHPERFTAEKLTQMVQRLSGELDQIQWP